MHYMSIYVPSSDQHVYDPFSLEPVCQLMFGVDPYALLKQGAEF